MNTKVKTGHESRVYLVRHGETPWTLTGQHTGNTEIALTPNGERQAERLRPLLERPFAKIFCSPLKRAVQTCHLATLSAPVDYTPLIAEWDYGDYEGLTTLQIFEKDPEWTIFSRGAPNGESVKEVSDRADQFLKELTQIQGDVLLFSHGHFLRVLAARWVQLDPKWGSSFFLSPGSLSILSHERKKPVIALWNLSFDKPPHLI